jgi:thymidylate synthase (FAD)
MPQFYAEPKVTVLARPVFVEPAHLPVNWIGESTDGERLAEFAGRLCYMSQKNPASRTTREYLENIKKQGHGSVLEHANYSLLLEGISRSLTHELVRHRAGFAYSQLSQRYVDESDAAFVIPPAIIGDDALVDAWKTQIESAQATYIALVDKLMTRYQWVDDKIHRRKMAREAARGVLPNSHRDQDRRHGQCARVAHDARTPLQRGCGVRDPSNGARGAPGDAAGGTELLQRLRGVHGGGPGGVGAD